jgi:hypothetical protein
MKRDKQIRVDSNFAKMLEEMANTFAMEHKLSKHKIGTREITSKLYDKIQERKFKKKVFKL